MIGNSRNQSVDDSTEARVEFARPGLRAEGLRPFPRRDIKER